MVCRTALHYALFWLILASASAQLTADQKTEIVDMLNNYRSSADPQPANMQRMLWDDAVSQVAENFAARCIWDHNPNVIGVLGESLFMTLGPLTLDFTLGLWYDENQNYDFNTDSCTPGKLCGDYTQMVWANTTFIGCAAQFCPTVVNFDAKNATILVCNFYPPGNIKGQQPYQVGLPCSSCPNSTIGCLSNSCDKGATFSSGISSNLIANLSNIDNFESSIGAQSSAGFTKPSAASFLLAGLMAVFIRLS